MKGIRLIQFCIVPFLLGVLFFVISNQTSSHQTRVAVQPKTAHLTTPIIPAPKLPVSEQNNIKKLTGIKQISSLATRGACQKPKPGYAACLCSRCGNENRCSFDCFSSSASRGNNASFIIGGFTSCNLHSSVFAASL